MRKLVAPLKKDRSRAHPPAFLWILLGIFGGLETLGLIGLFLGPVIMAAVMAIWREGCDEPSRTRPVDDRKGFEHS